MKQANSDTLPGLKLFRSLTFFILGITGFLLFPFPSVGSANATAKDVQQVADMCMYVQRILKDYALVGMGVNYHDPAADLQKNAKIIDQYIIDLESDHHLKKNLEDEVRELETLWKEIKPKVLSKPEKAAMTELHKKVEKFSSRCKEVAEDLAKDTGNEGEHYVVLIAQLGMECQRLAALYMMKAWGIADPNYYEEVEEVLAEYEKVYHELMDADGKLVSAEIKAKLKETEKHFMVFKFMAASKSGRFVPTMAEKSASKIFHEIRDILKLEKEMVE